MQCRCNSSITVLKILYSSKCMMYAETTTVSLILFPIKMKNNNTVPINERKKLKMIKRKTFSSAHALFFFKKLPFPNLKKSKMRSVDFFLGLLIKMLVRK